MIYLMAIIGFLVIVGGVWVHGRESGIQQQKALDEPAIATLSAQKAALESANKRFVDDLKQVNSDITQCNAKVEQIRAGSDQAIAQMEVLKAASEQRQKDYQRIVANYKLQMTSARNLPVDKQCAEAQKVLINLSDDMRALDALGLKAPTPSDVLKIEPEKAPPKPRPK